MLNEHRPLKVFLCHASQDKPAVRELYGALKRETWIDPWLDKVKILPGQDWRTEIEKAVEEADVVIVCLSSQSVSKEGFVQREIKYAYDVALEKPEETIFLIPLRLDQCLVPRGLHSFQWVDYFGAEKNDAYCILLDALKLRYEQKLKTKKEDRSSREKAEQTLQGNLGPESAEKAKYKEKERARKSKKKNSLKMDPAVTAAIIGVLGIIIVTLIILYANRPVPLPMTPTATGTFTATATDTPVPTDTIRPGEPTFTPVPATDTLVPTFTPVPPVALGQDWIAGCISTLWKPYPSDVPVIERGDGCWKEPVYVFSAENGDLDFLAEHRSRPAEIYGLFAPLPEQGTVTIKVRLRELNNADLWMGVFAEPDVNSQGLLMVIPSGDVDKRVFVQKSAPGFKMIASTSMLDQANGYSISFIVTENSVKSRINPSVFVTNPFSILSSQKWLFLGYKGLGGSYRIDGTFLGFELK